VITLTVYVRKNGNLEVAEETTFEQAPGFDELFKLTRNAMLNGATRVDLESSEVQLQCEPRTDTPYLIFGGPLPNKRNWMRAALAKPRRKKK
jgi:hypothetical protein